MRSGSSMVRQVRRCGTRLAAPRRRKPAMPMPLQDIEAEALQLPLDERGRLAGRLLESLEPEPQDTPENIARGWDEEIARRIDDIDAGRAETIPYEQVRAELRALIEARRDR